MIQLSAAPLMSAFGALAVVLVLIALLAGYVPAWRATHVEPTVALRQD
jgi:ABC-type lipoprotein release transport system permease subunit